MSVTLVQQQLKREAEVAASRGGYFSPSQKCSVNFRRRNKLLLLSGYGQGRQLA